MKAMPDCHTLIISDIHLGSKVCRADKVLELLRQARFKVLIINGDLFDADTTYKLSARHWDILSTITDIAKRQEVLLIGGNHGRKLDRFVKKIGIGLKEDYAFSVGPHRFLCLHGDEFDMFIRYLPRTSKLFTALYELIQQFGGETQKASMLIKRFSKSILHVPARQQKLALAHAAKRQASVVICSHTHLPHQDRQGGILFVNSGSFCDNPCSYVTVDTRGRVELREA